MRTQLDDISDNMGCLTYMFLFFLIVLLPTYFFDKAGNDDAMKIWVVISFLALHLYATGTFKKKKYH